MSERFKERIGEELYNKIIEAGIKSSEFDLLDGFVPRQRLNEVSEKLKATEGKVSSFEKQLGDTKKLLETNEEYKTKYSELETKFNTELEGKNKEIENVLKRSLIKESLINSGAKHPDLLLKEINFDTVKVDNNKLLGFDEQFTSIKDTYKDLFIEKVNKQDGNIGGNKDDGGKTGEMDLSFMDKL